MLLHVKYGDLHQPHHLQSDQSFELMSIRRLVKDEYLMIILG